MLTKYTMVKLILAVQNHDMIQSVLLVPYSRTSVRKNREQKIVDKIKKSNEF